MNNQINNIAINTAVRPPKVAVLINLNDKDWMVSCISIISMFSKMWGGEYNIIIPTDGKSIHDDFIKILKVYDADYIYYYESTVRQFKYFDVDKFNTIISKEKIKMDKEGIVRTKEEWENDNSFLNCCIYSLNIEEELENILDTYTNPFRIGISNKILKPLRYIEKVNYPITYIGDILEENNALDIELFELDFDCHLTKLLIYSKMGVVDANLFEDLKKMNFDINISKVNSCEKVSKCMAYAYDVQNTKGKVFFLSNYNTSYYVNNLYGENEKNVIILGDTLSDFCLYYSLSRLKNNVYWIPLLSQYIDDIYYNLDEQINFFQYRQENKGILLSHSLKEENIERYINELAKKDKIEFIKNNISNIKLDSGVSMEYILSNIRFVFNTNNHSNDTVMLFRDGKSIAPIDTPVPKKFEKISPDKHRWITEVNFDKYLIPQKSYLVNKILIQRNYSQRDIRITKNGLSYICPHTSYFSSWGDDINNLKIKPYLSILKPYETFKEIFLQARKHIKYSDKGFYEDEFITKIGSLDSVEKTLTDENYKLLLDKYIDTSKNEADVYNNGVYLNKRRYLDFNSINSLINDEVKVKNILEDLIEKGIILRGFIFKCSYCRNSDWYSIEEVKDEFKCKRCSITQKYSSDNLRLQPPSLRNEPIWYYKLEELSYQAYFHNSIVPLLTIATLKRSAKKSFEYISEIEIRSDEGSEKPDMEVDICCIVDGLVTIGECKKSDKLGEGNQTDEMVIDKYYKLAEEINADILVFSSYKGWKKSTKDKIIELQEKSKRCKIIIIENETLKGFEELQL